MSTSNYIPVLQAQLKFSQFLFQLPYYWHSGKYRQKDIWGSLKYSSDFHLNRSFRLKIFAFAFYYGFIVIRALKAILRKQLTLSHFLASVPISATYIGTTMAAINYLVEPDLLCQLFNETVYFWRVREKNQMKPKSKGILYYLPAGWIGGVVIGAFVIPMMFWLMPCSPIFLYSLNPSNCNSGEENETGVSWVKLLFYFVEVVLLLPLPAVGGFGCVLLMIMTVSLIKYPKHLW